MQFFNTLALAALASSAMGARVQCKKQGLKPYCCQGVTALNSLNVSLGIQCTPTKGKDLCVPANYTKQCCTQENISLLGLVTVCHLLD